MRFLVAGASDFLGKRLVWALLKSALPIEEIIILGRRKPQWLITHEGKSEKHALKISIRFIAIDLEDADALLALKIKEQALGASAIDCFIHCAPIWVLSRSLALLHDVFLFKRIMAFSSTSIISKQASNSVYEKELVAKLHAGEQSIMQNSKISDDAQPTMNHNHYRYQWTIFRPTLIYGYSEDNNITQISQFIQKYHFFPVVGKALGRRRPVHVDDLIQAIFKSLDNELTYNKIYTLSGAQALTYHQMVEAVFVGLSKTTRIIVIPTRLFRLALRFKKGATAEMANRMQEHLDFASHDAERDFDYSPRAFRSIK